MLVGDIGKAEDSGALQNNIVRIDGQRSVYVPIFKQGGDSNTITIVNGMKAAIKHLVDIPQSLKTAVVFDQSVFVKLAIKNLLKEASHRPGAHRHHDSGLPWQPASHDRGPSVDSALSAVLPAGHEFHGWIDQYHDPGRTGAGIFPPHRQLRHRAGKHLPPYGDGRNPALAAEQGGTEVSLAVLAATSPLPSCFSQLLSSSGSASTFSPPWRSAVVLSIFASYIFAMTVVPLYCAKFIRICTHEPDGHDGSSKQRGSSLRFEKASTSASTACSISYDGSVKRAMQRPGLTAVVICGGVAAHPDWTFPFLGRPIFRARIQANLSSTSNARAGTRIGGE